MVMSSAQRPPQRMLSSAEGTPQTSPNPTHPHTRAVLHNGAFLSHLLDQHREVALAPIPMAQGEMAQAQRSPPPLCAFLNLEPVTFVEVPRCEAERRRKSKERPGRANKMPKLQGGSGGGGKGGSLLLHGLHLQLPVWHDACAAARIERAFPRTTKLLMPRFYACCRDTVVVASLLVEVPVGCSIQAQ